PPPDGGQGHWPGRANSIRLGLAYGVYPGPGFLRFDRFLGLFDTLRPWALRVVGAGLEQAEPSPALDQRLAADRARLVQQLGLRRLTIDGQGAPELALRVARAAHERTEAAGLADEVALVAQGADLIGVGGSCLLGGAQHALERAIEVPHHRHPFLAA